jgi:nucleotide-binding universal stress UspA family protein
MALKDILVHVDNTKQCERRVEFAASVASAHGAHLVGLFVRTFPRVPPFVRSQFGPEVQALQKQFADESTDQAQELFERKLRNSGVNHEWRTGEGELFEVAATHARYADLTIVGQRNPDGDDEPPLADHLVLDAGRPVLVVPYAGTFTGKVECAIVAWNASREATRAVNDALPLLHAAKKVIVLAVNPNGGPDGHGEVPGADIGLHLARHGINAEAKTVQADDMHAGAMLLSRAADEGADLIVMGAYGRSRVRELVLGGATRHVLDHMTVPVLMSH